MLDTPSAARAPRRAETAWCLYDWANSAFATTVMAALFPPFYRGLCLEAGLPGATATAYWGYTTAGALLVAALLGPLLGAVADHTGGKKLWTAGFAALGVAATAAFTFIGPADWQLATLLYVLANVGFSGSIVFYEALLPVVAPAGGMDRVSSRGYALGYVGGGLLLALNAVMVMKPGWFGLAGTGAAVRASFVTVSVWWALFTLPLLSGVSEPPPARAPGEPAGAWRAGVARLGATAREVRRYRHLLLFLLAFWIYNDGIGTVIKMATAYGDELGIGVGAMTGALLVTQFVGVPFTLLFGRMAQRLGAKGAVLIALGVYVLIAGGGFFLRTAGHFYALAFLVGTVQGGSQALSRSLFGRLIPRHRAGEFFGFFSTSAKFAGIAGPLLFGAVSQTAGGSRLGIVSLIVFFGAGALLLARVDVAAGEAAARQAEREAGRDMARP